MVEKKFYVYILASKINGTLYVGVTSHLAKRISEHKNEAVEGFTKEHGVKILVYFEVFDDAENAIKREKKLKKWPRQWKLNVINEFNPEWNDLHATICQ